MTVVVRNAQFLFGVLSVTFLFCQGFLLSSVRRPFTSILPMRMVVLNTGEFQNVDFQVKELIEKDFGLFSVKATIKSKDMNEFLNEYKAEMKKKKVIFPGFRVGVIPPYVMGDIRRYIVCYGLETLLGKLANLNQLEVNFSSMS